MKLLQCASLALASCFAAPRHRGPATDHFDGHRFFNPGAPAPDRGFGAFMKWQLTADRGRWAAYRDEPHGPPPPWRVGPGQLRVTYVNHATTLVQLDGVNVLTDPIWSARASPVSFGGPRRVRPAGLRFDDLPVIDVVVLSHNHYDHLDRDTLQRLQATYPKLRVYAGLGNKAYLESIGLANVGELDWWQSTRVGATGLELTSVPVQHFSNRGLTDQDATLWTGWVLEGTQGRVYFAGDTAYGGHFKAVGERLGPFRLAVLPIGAYLPEWFMRPIHMSPAEAWQAKGDLRARVMVPMHFGTFALADDGETAPLDALQAASAGDPGCWVLGFGEGREVPP